MDLIKRVYEYFYPKKYCFINEHGHIINVQVDGNKFDICPMEHRILSFDTKSLANILCEICQVNTETVFKVSNDLDNYKNPIIYIDNYLYSKESA